jgi:hypothetical protein
VIVMARRLRIPKIAEELFDITGREDGMGPYGREPIDVDITQVYSARERARMIGIPDSWSFCTYCLDCGKTIYLPNRAAEWKCFECGGIKPCWK